MQAGPVLSCVDDAHRLDNASIGLPRRVAWFSRLTPSAVSGPCHVLPPVDPVDVRELVRERLGAWRSADPLRRSRPSRGDPLFVLLLWGTRRPGACSSGRVAAGSPCRATRVPSRHLYASPRRVQSHVPHILAKLDLRSRMGIAAQCADVAPAWTEHRHDGGCLLDGGFLASLP